MGKEIKPTILKEGSYSRDDLDNLRQKSIWQEKNILGSQLGELFEIENPNMKGSDVFQEKCSDFIKERLAGNDDLCGDYIYFPWSGILLHTATESEQRKLRTNRTKNLITDDEQLLMKAFNAGIAGLSFGNGIALALVYMGFADTIKIADTDIFETTNLNRVRVGLSGVGEPKTSITAQQIYEINPYADIQIFDGGLSDGNLEEFIGGSSKLKIIFDVVDDLSMKVKLRIAARKSKIPVVMLTSLEDSVLVDVERFDLDNEGKIFHGLLGDIENDLLNKTMSEADKAKYAMAIVGAENVSYRNLSSLKDVGNKLVSRPHLFSTVSMVCGLAPYIAKRIALGEDMPSVRRLIKFNEIIGISENSHDSVEKRKSILEEMMGVMDNN